MRATFYYSNEQALGSFLISEVSDWIKPFPSESWEVRLKNGKTHQLTETEFNEFRKLWE